MSVRPWRNAFGLRGRIVGAVLVTTVATLSVAAVALLGPLEHALRRAAKTTLTTDLKTASSKQTVKTFRQIVANGNLIYVGDPKSDAANYEVGLKEAGEILAEEALIKGQLGATSAVLIGFIGPNGEGRPIPNGPQAVSDTYPDVAVVFRGRDRHPLPYFSYGTFEGKPVVRAAIWLGHDSVLTIRKSIDEIPDAVHAVATAFIYAALAGIVLTLLLGIPLAATLVRRLQRLRETAVQLTVEGTAAEVRDDRVRDEVGDLARTFALMQRRLQHQEEARRAFVATASHELRTPLASLDVMLELLAEDLRDGELDLDDAHTLLDRARVQSRRLGRLAADLLDLSRIDAEVQLRSEPVELGELSRAVLAEFELGTRERGVNCALHDGEEPVWALADPGRVARILRILLDNALRVAPRGSEITVELPQAAEPTLRVLDEGPGIAPEERELIFDRFKRGRDTGGEAGFGLGLAIGRELAVRMGGSLELEPEGGSGATFVLRLRVAKAPAADPMTPATQPS
jgi:signal transduction histidine kinase